MPTPGSAEWKERVRKLLVEEMATPWRWHYCSFAGETFLGALFIEGHGPTDISVRSHHMGLNPGGEMMCIELPDGAPLPEEKYRNRLLSKQELKEAVGEIVKSDGTPG